MLTAADAAIVIAIRRSWHILAPHAVAYDSLHLRANAHLWHVSAFLCNRKFPGISCYIKIVPTYRLFCPYCRDCFYFRMILSR
jgi:hypothetical protein